MGLVKTDPRGMRPLPLAQLCSKVSPLCPLRSSLPCRGDAVTIQVCSMKDNRRKGIHPRAGFGSPGRCEGGRKRHGALQPPSFSLGEGLVRSNPTCCVFIHGYLPIPGRRMSSGSSLPPSFPAPCHPQTATVWLGLCPEGWHLMRGLHRTLSPTAKSTPEGGTFSQQPCYDYLGDSAPI